MSDSEAVQAQAAESGPRITLREGYKKRRARVEFDGDYQGVWVEVWVNCPKRLLNAVASNDVERSDRAMAAFIVDHNFQYPVDEERPEEPPESAPDDWAETWQPAFRAGDRMPAPITPEAVSYIPVDLYRKTVELGLEALQEAGKVSKRGRASD